MQAAPALAWSSFVGSSAYDQAHGVALDPDGNVVVGGVTHAAGWTSSGLDDELDGPYDGFVAKFTGTGELLWARLLGGAGQDEVLGVTVDRSGNIFVVGRTTSADWAVGGYDVTFNGDEDAFVARLTPEGVLEWSTYVGGGLAETGSCIVLNDDGDPVIGGWTTSPGWVSGGAYTTPGGWLDGFVAKLTAAGAFAWSSYLGGAGSERCRAIACDRTGAVLAAGYSDSDGWISGGYGTDRAATDAFLVKLAADGSALWSTYIGGADYEGANGVDVMPGDDVVVCGETTSTEAWVSGGYDTTHGGGSTDGFAVCVSAAGEHRWSTFIGGGSTDSAVAVRPADGGVWIAGQTTSAGWFRNGFDTSAHGSVDAFVLRLGANGEHIWSACIGGYNGEYPRGLAASPAGTACLVGGTVSPGWTTGGNDTTYNGDMDGFVVRVEDDTAYRLSVQSTPVPGVAVSSGTGHGGSADCELMPLWLGTAVELTAPAMTATSDAVYILVAWLNLPDGGVVSPDGRTLSFAVTADAAPVASYRLAEPVLPDGAFLASVGAGGVGAGRGIWDLSGHYSTTVAGDDLAMELVHDGRGRITGTALCQVAVKSGKRIPVAMAVKGAVTSSSGTVRARLALRGADAAGGIHLAMVYALAVDTSACRLRGTVCGSRRTAAGAVPLSGEVELDVPPPMAGTWDLALDLASTGTVVTGKATLVLSNGVGSALAVRGRMAGTLAVLRLNGVPGDHSARGLRMNVAVEPLEGGRARLAGVSGELYGQRQAW